MRNVRADWREKRREARIRRAADEMIMDRMREAVEQRIGRLKIAADNLDQQTELISRERGELNGV